MREVAFEVFARSGLAGEPHRGDVTDLLLHVPYLFVFGMIPPLSVVNEILRTGVDDAAMSGGCRWEPFEIDAAEWARVRERLEAPPHGHRFEEPPAAVRTRQEWTAWLFERRSGMPADEYLALSRELERLEEEGERAVQAGDRRRAAVLRLETMKVGTRLARLAMDHLRPPGGSQESSTS